MAVLLILGMAWCPVLGPPPHPWFHDAASAGHRLEVQREPRRTSSAFSYGLWSGDGSLDDLASRGEAVPEDLQMTFFYGVLTSGIRQSSPPLWTALEVEERIPEPYRMYLHARAINGLTLVADEDTDALVRSVARYAMGVSSVPLGKSLAEGLLARSPYEPWLAYSRAAQYPESHWPAVYETVAAELSQNPTVSWDSISEQTPEGALCFAVHGFLRGRVHEIPPIDVAEWRALLELVEPAPASCFPAAWRGLSWGLLSSPALPRGLTHMELIERIDNAPARNMAIAVFKELGSQPSPMLLPWAHYVSQAEEP